jgi:hypothetical protein
VRLAAETAQRDIRGARHLFFFIGETRCPLG